MGAVGPGHLVVEPAPASGKVDEVEVAQPPAGVGRLGRRVRAKRGKRDGRVARGDAGALLIVLGRAGPPVVERDHRLAVLPHRADPGAPRVPVTRPAAQRGAVPGPVEPVGAGRVVAHHLVGLGRIGQRVAARPHLPAAVQPDHRVLDACLRISGNHDHALGGVELGRMRGLKQFDPPVLGARRGTAQVQPPPSRPVAHQSGPFQRLRADLVAPDGGERLEMHSVGRPRHRDGVAAPGPDRPAQPVGQIDAIVAQGRAGGTGPVAQAGSGRGDHDCGLIGARQERCSRALWIYATNHIGILDSRSGRVLGECDIARIRPCLT